MLNKPNILVVAGDSECGCLGKNLDNLGNVTVAQSIAEALRHLKTGLFDVLFCAWEMKGGSWSDLMASLSAENLQLPAVVYYHCGGEEEWAVALERGAFDLLTPPFDLYKLRVLLEHAMAAREHTEQVA